MKPPTRTSAMDGVTVSVVLFDHSFNVFVEIDEGCNLAKKRKNSFFSIKFCTDGKSPIIKEHLSLKLRYVEYPDKNFVVNFKETLSMPNGMTCTLSLSPEFYLSKPLIKIYQKQRDKGSEKARKRKMKKADQKALDRFYRTAWIGSCSSRTSSQATINGRPATNFTRNNVFKPYQGGGCSSK